MRQERKSDGRIVVKHHDRDVTEQISGQTTKATTKGWGEGGGTDSKDIIIRK